MSKIDLKTITKNAQAKTTKIKTSIFVEATVWEKFVEKCKDTKVKSSKVLEEFMKEYIK